MSSETDVFLIDSNCLFRDGLKRILADSGYRVIKDQQEPDLSDPIARADGRRLLIIADIAANEPYAEKFRRIKGLFPDARILMLSDSLDYDLMTTAFRLGASGYLLKNITPEGLLRSLDLLLCGERVYPSSLAEALTCGRVRVTPLDVAGSGKKLTTREAQILNCLIEGDSNKHIANRLKISEATVKIHLKSLLRKIGATNRTQAAIWAMNHQEEA